MKLDKRDGCASKACGFGAGCSLSSTVTMVCWSTNKLSASTRAWCFFGHRKSIRWSKNWLGGIQIHRVHISLQVTTSWLHYKAPLPIIPFTQGPFHSVPLCIMQVTWLSLAFPLTTNPYVYFLYSVWHPQKPWRRMHLWRQMQHRPKVKVKRMLLQQLLYQPQRRKINWGRTQV